MFSAPFLYATAKEKVALVSKFLAYISISLMTDGLIHCIDRYSLHLYATLLG